MKQIELKAEGQVLTCTNLDTLNIVGDSVGQYEATLTLDSTWNGYVPIVRFTRYGIPHDRPALLDGNALKVKDFDSALVGGGEFSVTVIGLNSAGERKTTGEVKITVAASGIRQRGTVMADAEFEAQVAEALANDAANEKVANRITVIDEESTHDTYPTSAGVNSRIFEVVSSNMPTPPLVASSVGEMTETTRLYVNTTDGEIYAYADSAWASTGVLYQATGIANEGVTPDKTSFFESETATGKNKYDHTKTTTGFVLGATGLPNNDSGWETSDYIPIVYGDKVYFSYDYYESRVNTIRKIAVYTAEKTYSKDSTNRFGADLSSFTMACRDGAFIRVSSPSAGDNQQLEIYHKNDIDLGVTEYEEYQQYKTYDTIYSENLPLKFLDETSPDYNYKNYELTRGKIVDYFNDLDSFSVVKYPNIVGNLSNATNNYNYSKRKSAIRLSVTQPTAGVSLSKPIAVDLSNDDGVALWVHLDNLLNNCFVNVIFYSDLSTDNNHRANKAFYTNNMYFGWQMVHAIKNEFTVGESFDWANITRVTISAVTDSINDYFSVSVSDLSVGVSWSPKIIFRFDDGLKGVYTKGYPALLSRGMSGITYVNSKFSEFAEDDAIIDPVTGLPYSDVYCSPAELTEMYANGFDIGNHSWSHLIFTGSTVHYDYEDAADIEEKRTSVLYQILKTQRWLVNQGFNRSSHHFAVPGGNDTEMCQAALNECGVLTSTNSQYSDNVPTVNCHKIHAWGIMNTDSVATVEAYIANAIANGHTCVLMFHDIVDIYNDHSEAKYQYLTNNFESVLDYIVSHGWHKYVVNMSTWYEGLNRGHGLDCWSGN